MRKWPIWADFVRIDAGVLDDDLFAPRRQRPVQVALLGQDEGVAAQEKIDEAAAGDPDLLDLRQPSLQPGSDVVGQQEGLAFRFFGQGKGQGGRQVAEFPLGGQGKAPGGAGKVVGVPQERGDVIS